LTIDREVGVFELDDALFAGAFSADWSQSEF
jgi:hypothetical protein